VEKGARFVAVEADSTYLAGWRGGRGHEVHVGMSYTGKTGTGKRNRLQGRRVCASRDGSERFGWELFGMSECFHGSSRAACGVFISDGAAALRKIHEEHFFGFSGQPDWAHAKRRVSEACGRERRGRAGGIIEMLEAGDLRDYLERHGKDLYATRKLRKRHEQIPPRLDGSGAIERQIGVLVAQRMKKRGMSWTRAGASNLFAVRTDLLNRLWNAKPGNS
jgi:hypothetical protein